MDKKGLSHVEFIISFVIFVGFIIFAFAFFNPLQSNRTLKSSMDYAWIEISKDAMAKLETYSVSINEGYPETKIKIGISSVPSTYNASVEDVDGNILQAYKNLGVIHFDRVQPSRRFFRIKYSSAIANGPDPGGAYSYISPDNYYVSSSEVKEIYFERLFAELNKSYFSNYTGLRQKLNLPNRVDFGFVVKFNDSQINAVNEIPENLEVLSRNDRVEIIRDSGRKEYAEVTVLVW